MKTEGGFVTYFAHWFAPALGLVYLSGYLIDSSFYSSVGVTDAGGEILKLRYIRTGLYFLISFAVLWLPIIFLFFEHKRISDQTKKMRRAGPNIVIGVKGFMALRYS